MKINQTNGLNRQARKFLLSNLVSKRGAEVELYGFNGYLNGNEVEDITLIRKNGKWQVVETSELVFSLNGTADFFSVTDNTIN